MSIGISILENYRVLKSVQLLRSIFVFLTDTASYAQVCNKLNRIRVDSSISNL